MKKRLISVLLACMMILTVLPAIVGAGDAETEKLSIEIAKDVQLSNRKGSTVNVDVNITTNQKIVSATIPIAWNVNDLELVDVKNYHDTIESGWIGYDKYEEMTDGIYFLAWNNDTLCDVDAQGQPIEKSYSGPGRLCTLVFKLKKDVNAGTDYAITVAQGGDEKAIMNIMNWYMEDFLNQKEDDSISGVTVEFVEGGIKTVDSLAGDVDRNNIINIQDAFAIVKYMAHWPGFGEGDIDVAAANVDGNTVINIQDAFTIVKHMAHWPGFETLPLAN